MKRKVKQFLISFIFMIIAYLGIAILDLYFDLELFMPHVGLLFVFGLIFGPYGALGAVAGNVLLDSIGGYTPIEILPSEILSFGVSYLGYKLWYSGFRGHKATTPQLDNIYHISLFLAIIFVSGTIYSVFHGHFLNILLHIQTGDIMSMGYFFNFINFAFILGILGIWIFKRLDLIEAPKISKRSPHTGLYRAIFCLMIIITIISTITLIYVPDENISLIESILLFITLFAYLTKPFTSKIHKREENTILKNIINIFLSITLIIAVAGVMLNFLGHANQFINPEYSGTVYFYMIGSLVITDIIIFLCFVPGFITIRYIEKKVTNPISSFSEIEEFIKEDEKIQADALLDIYSEYIGEKDEIGKLARSYTDLIKHNNNYIDNIHEIESEKERIKAELDIATKIQASNLPTEALETDEYIVEGYSKPAKEVGGDFFDYYPIDDSNLALVIGDASGKGVPAALLSTITQVMIKQILQHETDPSQVLYSLNNQLCENNSETMFITLWLGIYNKNTGKITFSNAGHNPPLIKINDEFRYLNMETGIVLGIMEDFEFVTEEMDFSSELALYTDGITDANDYDDEMYGEERLLKFFNEHKSNAHPITALLDDIKAFTKEKEQYDDMTLIYLKKK